MKFYFTSKLIEHNKNVKESGYFNTIVALKYLIFPVSIKMIHIDCSRTSSHSNQCTMHGQTFSSLNTVRMRTNQREVTNNVAAIRFVLPGEQKMKKKKVLLWIFWFGKHIKQGGRRCLCLIYRHFVGILKKKGSPTEYAFLDIVAKFI